MKRFVMCVLLACKTCSAQMASAEARPAQVPSTGARGPAQLCGIHNTAFQVKLLSPLGTETAKPGDTFTLQVLSPPPYGAGTIEGNVRTLVQAQRGFGKGKPSIDLDFTTLTLNNRACSIGGELQRVTNSKGVAKIDDEGRMVGHTSNKPRFFSALAGSAVGAAIGAAAGGGNGAIAGGAAGAAAGFLLGSTLTAAGKDIQFQPGAVFTLNISDGRQERR